MSLIRTRLIVGAGTLALSLGFASWLVYAEASLEPEVPRAITAPTPPTLVMRYLRSSRADNFEVLGLKDVGALEAATAYADALPVDALRALLTASAADELRAVVAGAFCVQEVPMPYRAARVLVQDVNGRPELVDVRTAKRLKPWAGYPAEPELEALVKRFEGGQPRADADTAIALAALLRGDTARAVGEGPAPYERMAEGAQLGRLFDERARLTLARYVATAVVLAEIVEERPADYGCGG